MPQPRFTAIRVQKLQDGIVVIGEGRSARGSRFYKKQVTIEGDPKDKKDYKRMIEEGFVKLGYDVS